jgi:hypothetical protein
MTTPHVSKPERFLLVIAFVSLLGLGSSAFVWYMAQRSLQTELAVTEERSFPLPAGPKKEIAPRDGRRGL